MSPNTLLEIYWKSGLVPPSGGFDWTCILYWVFQLAVTVFKLSIVIGLEGQVVPDASLRQLLKQYRMFSVLKASKTISGVTVF